MVFKLIRTVLGLESSDSSSETDVTVERESDTAAADTDAAASTGSMTEQPPKEGAAEPAEAAGEASTTTGTDDGPEPDDDSQAEAAAAGTDAAASTGSMTEEPPEEDAATEPAEAAGPVSEGDDSEPVENVSGIGPAYADRLGEAGIETVDRLLEADPEELAEATDLSAKRVRRWQERAEEL